MVILFAGFTIVFTDNALGTALIQRRDVREEDKSTVFWFSAALGVALAVAGVLVAGPLADFYDEPSVRWLFVAFSVGFIVNALGTTQMALLVREMQFRRLELRQMAATIVGAATGITIALAGLGAWAIVGQLLAEAVTSTALLWLLSPWRPSFVFSTASFNRLGGFAGNVFAQNIVWQSARSLSGVLIARVLGAAALGVYTLATTVILTPFVRIAAPLQQVFLPAFSEMRDEPERMADLWIRATRMVAAISIPSLIGIAIVASDFVEVVLGPRWSDAAPVIQILAVVGILQSLHTLNAEVFLALGRTRDVPRLHAALGRGDPYRRRRGGAGGHRHGGGVLRHRHHSRRAGAGVPDNARARNPALAICALALGGGASVCADGDHSYSECVRRFRRRDVPASVRLVLLLLAGAASYLGASVWRAPDVTREIAGVMARRRPALSRRSLR